MYLNSIRRHWLGILLHSFLDAAIFLLQEYGVRSRELIRKSEFKSSLPHTFHENVNDSKENFRKEAAVNISSALTSGGDM
jgi:hypothetical protein